LRNEEEGDQEEERYQEILSTVDVQIQTLNKATEQNLFSIDGSIDSLIGNLNYTYAKMIQDITNYEIRMEQKVMLKAMKNDLEVYKEFDKSFLTDQILLLFLFYENVL
jgi:hypothetical protein